VDLEVDPLLAQEGLQEPQEDLHLEDRADHLLLDQGGLPVLLEVLYLEDRVAHLLHPEEVQVEPEALHLVLEEEEAQLDLRQGMVHQKVLKQGDLAVALKE